LLDLTVRSEEMSTLDELATFDEGVASHAEAPPIVSVKAEEVFGAPATTDEQQQQQQSGNGFDGLLSSEDMNSPLTYFRYYVGHVGRHGNEFLEFDINSEGVLKYANNSNYRKDTIIKKQCKVSASVLQEMKRLIIESHLLECDDSSWPEPDRNGRQELEVHIGNTHLSLVTNKITLFDEVERSHDPKGLESFFFLVRDMKALVLALVGLHFKIKAI
jgi:protein mago nashi